MPHLPARLARPLARDRRKAGGEAFIFLCVPGEQTEEASLVGMHEPDYNGCVGNGEVIVIQLRKSYE